MRSPTATPGGPTSALPSQSRCGRLRRPNSHRAGSYDEEARSHRLRASRLRAGNLAVIVVRAGGDRRVLGLGGLAMAVRPGLDGTVPVGVAVHRDALGHDLVEPGLDPAQAAAHAWSRNRLVAVTLPGGQGQRDRDIE